MSCFSIKLTLKTCSCPFPLWGVGIEFNKKLVISHNSVKLSCLSTLHNKLVEIVKDCPLATFLFWGFLVWFGLVLFL